MRLVLDTNQASRFVHNTSSNPNFAPTIVVPPFVWAEILLAPECHHRGRIDAIKKYNLTFGMDFHYTYDRLCNLTEDEIRVFDPVFPVETEEHQRLLASFSSPREEQISRAREIKENAGESAQEVSDRHTQYKREIQVSKSKGEELQYEAKFTDIEDADERLISGKNAPLRTSFVDQVTDHGAQQIRAASRDSLFDAILENHQLRRFLRLYITFAFAYVNQWSEEDLNRIDPARTRNDLTDIGLALYACDGDAIISEDAYLRRAFRHVDPDCQVALSTWDQIVTDST